MKNSRLVVRGSRLPAGVVLFAFFVAMAVAGHFRMQEIEAARAGNVVKSKPDVQGSRVGHDDVIDDKSGEWQMSRWVK